MQCPLHLTHEWARHRGALQQFIPVAYWDENAHDAQHACNGIQIQSKLHKHKPRMSLGSYTRSFNVMLPVIGAKPSQSMLLEGAMKGWMRSLIFKVSVFTFCILYIPCIYRIQNTARIYRAKTKYRMYFQAMVETQNQ